MIFNIAAFKNDVSIFACIGEYFICKTEEVIREMLKNTFSVVVLSIFYSVLFFVCCL